MITVHAEGNGRRSFSLHLQFIFPSMHSGATSTPAQSILGFVDIKKIHYWMWMLRVLFEGTPQFLLGDGAAAHRLPWRWYVTLNMIKIFVECDHWFSYDEIECVCWIKCVTLMWSRCLLNLINFSMCWMWMSGMFMLNVMYDLKYDRDACWIWLIFMSWMRMWSLNVIVILECDQIWILQFCTIWPSIIWLLNNYSINEDDAQQRVQLFMQ